MIFILGTAIAYAVLVKDYLRTPYDSLFDEAGREYSIDSNLLRALGRHESNFNPKAFNKETRDYGLMQINRTNFTFLGLDETSVYDVRKNVFAAGKLLHAMRIELGETFSTLHWIAAYNAGTPRVKRDGVFNFPYASTVFTHYSLYQMGRIFA